MNKIDTNRPAYRVLNDAGFYGPDDNLYTVGSEVYYDGEPNEQLEPLNEIARLNLIKHIEKLEREAKDIAAKLGRPFSGRPRNLDGGLTLATELQRAGVSIMGVKRDVDTITKIQKEETPETGVKRGRGRPPGQKVRAKYGVEEVTA